MKIAVLALQGAFIEHKQKLEAMGISCMEIRQKADLEQHFDGLVLPGGESTVQGKLLRELDLLEPLRERIAAGMPVMGTCAGLILLAKQIEKETGTHMATLPITVSRNAYGRQLGSFYTEARFADYEQVPMTFIRAPYVSEVSRDVSVLAKVDERIVAVRFKNQLGIAFHPELTASQTVHEYFLSMIQKTVSK